MVLFPISAILAALAVLFILNRELCMMVVERTTVRSAERLGGSYLRHVGTAKEISRWLLPTICLAGAAITLLAGIREL